MRLSFVLGTAAELIKVYPVLHQAQTHGLVWQVLSTGQSGVGFFRQYDDFQLPRERLMAAVSSQVDLEKSGAALRWFAHAYGRGRKRLPLTPEDVVVVHGDTLSTLVGARWARHHRLPLAHIEAGLRSRSLFNPFPEEINRRWVSRHARIHFAPGSWAADNLRKAKVQGEVIDTLANTLVDALPLMLKLPPRQPLPSVPFVLANLHRYENLQSSKRWAFLVDTLLEAARRRRVILVQHPQTQEHIEQDPRTKERLTSAGVVLQPRLPFLDFIHLFQACDFMISDGGSNQEESLYLGKPCLILRENTERQEGLGSTVCLARFDQERVRHFLAKPEAYQHPPWRPANSPSAIVVEHFMRVARSGSNKSDQ